MKTIGMAGLLLAALAVATPARAGHDIPIRMSGSITASDSPDLGCSGFRGTNSGVLTGPPFGRATWTDHHCGDALAEPGVITVRDANFTLVSRAGSISGTLDGRGILADGGGQFFASGHFTVTSGTGRYAGATGGGLVQDAGPAVGGSDRFEISGSLTLR